MRLGVLATPQSWYVRDLQRAAEGRHAIDILSFASLKAGLRPEPDVRSIVPGAAASESLPLDQYDAILVRSMPPGSLEQVVFRMNALHQLAAQGIPVFNPPRSLEVAVDKYLTSALLQRAGLPIPRTLTSQTYDQALEDFHALGGDVVLKPLFGGEGRGITRLQDEAIAERVFRTLAQLGHVLYQQEFIAHPGHDLRVLVIGHKLFGMRRCNSDDWRTNVSRGATAEPLEVNEELAELARRAAAAVGVPFAGVDILPGPDGQLYLLEVNAVPGWRGLARALQRDIAREVLDWIAAEIA